MEKGLEWQFDSYLQEIFQLKEVDVQEYSPLTLAYIGDGIYDLVIRTLVINRGNKQCRNFTRRPAPWCRRPRSRG